MWQAKKAYCKRNWTDSVFLSGREGGLGIYEEEENRYQELVTILISLRAMRATMIVRKKNSHSLRWNIRINKGPPPSPFNGKYDA